MKAIKELIPYFVIIVCIVIIRFFFITPVSVIGDSMKPNLLNGQVLLLSKFDKSIDRFDVVVFNYNGEKLVKRVIGLPGEYVEYSESKLYINGEYIEEKMISVPTSDFKMESITLSDVIPEGYYFVVGDNRGISKDSRVIGLINKKEIIGVVKFSIFPFNRFGSIK